MRIECPSCQAAYEVPDALLAGGPRRVRCARCGKEWQPTPLSREAPAADPAVAAPPPAAAPPAGPPPAAPPPATPAPAASPALAPPATGPATTAPPAALPPRPEAAPPLAPPPPRPVRPPSAMRMVEQTHPARDAPRGGGVAVQAAWVASGAALGAIGWAGYALRADIVAAWPASARLYAWLGLLP